MALKLTIDRIKEGENFSLREWTLQLEKQIKDQEEEYEASKLMLFNVRLEQERRVKEAQAKKEAAWVEYAPILLKMLGEHPTHDYHYRTEQNCPHCILNKAALTKTWVPGVIVHISVGRPKPLRKPEDADNIHSTLPVDSVQKDGSSETESRGSDAVETT